MFRFLPDGIESDFFSALPLWSDSLEACCLLNHQPCIQQSKSKPERRRPLVKCLHSSSSILYKNDTLEHSGDEGVDTGAPRSDWALLFAAPTIAWRIDSDQYRYLTACNQASLFILYHNGRSDPAA